MAGRRRSARRGAVSVVAMEWKAKEATEEEKGGGDSLPFLGVGSGSG